MEQETNKSVVERSLPSVESFDEFYKFLCPHCGISIVVMKQELKCRIFRCGQYKRNGMQIPPHSPKNICDKLRENEQIYGCARPFIFKESFVEPSLPSVEHSLPSVEPCDYI